MQVNKLLKDLRECSGIGYEGCKAAIEYCRKHPDCSPLAWLNINYNGVRHRDFDKAVKDETYRLEYQPPHWARGTDICIPWKKLYGTPSISKDSFAEIERYYKRYESE